MTALTTQGKVSFLPLLGRSDIRSGPEKQKIVPANTDAIQKKLTAEAWLVTPHH